MALTEIPIELSSTPGIVDNSNATAITIDASENVGIGNSSPTDKLHLGTSSGATQLKIQSGSGINNCILHTNGTTDSWRTGMNLSLTDGSYEFYDDVNNVSRMVIGASGNVGIGTSTPAAKLDLGTSTGQKLLMYANSNIKYGMSIETSDYRIFAEDQASLTFGHMARADGTTYNERLRIDASGNLLVGKSGTAFGTAGIEASASNGLWSTRSGLPALALNRLSTDGSIADFYKDGAVVGSIGYGAGVLGIGQGTGNLGLFNETVIPMGSTSGAASDGVISLGGSNSRRFKDLYLSGGVRGTSTLDITIPETSGGAIQLEFGNNVNDTRRTVRAYKDTFEPAAADTGVISLGQAANKWKDLYLSGGVVFGDAGGSGTSSSNTLDSYEEGTWQPILAGSGTSSGTQTYTSTNTARYTKVGDTVTCFFDFEIDALGGVAGNNAVLRGVPFTISTTHIGGGHLNYYTGLSGTTGPVVLYAAGAQLYMLTGDSYYVARTAIASGTRLMGQFVYRTTD